MQFLMAFSLLIEKVILWVNNIDVQFLWIYPFSDILSLKEQFLEVVCLPPIVLNKKPIFIKFSRWVNFGLILRLFPVSSTTPNLEVFVIRQKYKILIFSS